MPADGKICTFDCIYCECGLNKDFRPKTRRPTREEVACALEQRLISMRDTEGCVPDVLTFAGNGEPTVHPDFPAIIDDTIRLRDIYCPQAKVSVLSNATRAHLPEVKAALMKVDNNILKLDTVDAAYIDLVDQPVGEYDVDRIVETMRQYRGKCIVQTMFMKGEYNGKNVDNTDEKYVGPWLEALKEIVPQQVMIYTIDRETPLSSLSKATPDELDAIAKRIEALGLAVSVSY
jgi:wyosine [tRNA(Phe)-imidazoG37] synthetase (radical SAM superfamily)